MSWRPGGRSWTACRSVSHVVASDGRKAGRQRAGSCEAKRRMQRLTCALGGASLEGAKGGRAERRCGGRLRGARDSSHLHAVCMPTPVQHVPTLRVNQALPTPSGEHGDASRPLPHRTGWAASALRQAVFRRAAALLRAALRRWAAGSAANPRCARRRPPHTHLAPSPWRVVLRRARAAAAPSSLLAAQAQAAPAPPLEEEGVDAAQFFDPRMGARGLKKMNRRARATFEFVEEGELQRQADAFRCASRVEGGRGPVPSDWGGKQTLKSGVCGSLSFLQAPVAVRQGRQAAPRVAAAAAQAAHRPAGRRAGPGARRLGFRSGLAA